MPGSRPRSFAMLLSGCLLAGEDFAVQFLNLKGSLLAIVWSRREEGSEAVCRPWPSNGRARCRSTRMWRLAARWSSRARLARRHADGAGGSPPAPRNSGWHTPRLEAEPQTRHNPAALSSPRQPSSWIHVHVGDVRGRGSWGSRLREPAVAWRHRSRPRRSRPLRRSIVRRRLPRHGAARRRPAPSSLLPDHCWRPFVRRHPTLVAEGT